MSEVIDKPDAKARVVVNKAIKKAQEYARQNAKEPEREYYVTWITMCQGYKVAEKTVPAVKTGPNTWEGTDPIDFGQGSCCALAVKVSWDTSYSPPAHPLNRWFKTRCVRHLIIRRWKLVQSDKGIQAEVELNGIEEPRGW